MSKGKNREIGFGKALSLWEAPEGAGDPRVCIATTFTFDATFFETECLGRFLQMDSHPSESESVAYLVEREEKLAASQVCVLADRRHAKDKESLRWDVLGVVVPRAIQHSKVSLLVWTNHVRIVIGSGNLTEPGYRKNVEVFGCFDLTKESGDRDAVERTLDFLAEVEAAAVGTTQTNSPRTRARAALTTVRRHIRRWSPSNGAGAASPIFGTTSRSVVDELKSHWPASARPVRDAYVLSPFFDENGHESKPVSALMPVLAKKGRRSVCFDVRAEPRPDGRTRLFAPVSMVKTAAVHADVHVRPVMAEQNGELRTLHAKMVYLSNDAWVVVLAGSSNFTTAGMGAKPKRANLEANVVYRVRTSDRQGVKALDAVWPEVGDELDWRSDDLIWDPRDDAEEGEGDVPLPAAFEEAIFVPGEPAALELTLVAPLPDEWSIRAPNGPVLLSSSTASPGAHDIPWLDNQVPFVLEVAWTSKAGAFVANWPVNVSNPAALPAPEALRELTLAELLEILASTRPLHQAVAAALKKRGQGTTSSNELDPLKRHDSQQFLLRRTKRVAAALERLRERLERPVFTPEAFDWRLSGPVGVLALAQAFVKESKLAGEGQFCLAELALALSRVRIERAASVGVKRSAIRDRIRSAIAEVRTMADGMTSVPELEPYVQAAFEEASS